ncbi:MAG: hypothetical protein ACRCRP_00455 [Metamycoplasmataceae bacterium]
MIQKIIFRKTDSISENNIFTIEFSDKSNIIIGPKGGGKSTLFDLLTGIKNGYICDSVKAAYKEFGLEFISAFKFNGEEINSMSLSKKTKKEKEEDFKNRFDVIYQDDEIKKNLNNTSTIKKKKEDFLRKKLNNSNSVVNFSNKIKSFYEGMKNIFLLNETSEVNINWNNTFKMNDLINNDINILIKLNYNPRDILNSIKSEIDLLKLMHKEVEEFKYSLQKWGKNSFFQKTKNNLFEEKFISSIKKNIESNNELMDILLARINELKKTHLIISIFNKAYNKEIDIIKNKNFNINGLQKYEISAKDHFRQIAKKTFKQKMIFDKLINEDEEIIFSKEEGEEQELLYYSMKEKVVINQEIIIKILKNFLPSPVGSNNNINNWLKSLINKNFKVFDDKKIIDILSKELIESVNVIADGMDYENMSLGQRSIYGIKYKLNKCFDNEIFMDQPEDNLDNKTIATILLPMIQDKKDSQLFIITHNANIGILSNPKKVIVADLKNKETPYEIEEISYDDSKLLSVNYLEGGKQYLTERFKKIIKGE